MAAGPALVAAGPALSGSPSVVRAGGGAAETVVVLVLVRVLVPVRVLVAVLVAVLVLVTASLTSLQAVTSHSDRKY